MILFVDIAMWLKAGGAAVVAANGARVAWKVALLRSSGSVATIEISAGDAMTIGTRRGEWIEVDVCGDTYVLWFLTVLNVRRRDNGRRVSIVIFPDAVDAEEFRKLRVWLRWKARSEPRGAK